MHQHLSFWKGLVRVSHLIELFLECKPNTLDAVLAYLRIVGSWKLIPCEVLQELFGLWKMCDVLLKGVFSSIWGSIKLTCFSVPTSMVFEKCPFNSYGFVIKTVWMSVKMVRECQQLLLRSSLLVSFLKVPSEPRGSLGTSYLHNPVCSASDFCLTMSTFDLLSNSTSPLWKGK